MVVILVASDPKPPEMAVGPERNGAIGSADINRPDVALGLKAERRVIRVSSEKLVFLNGQVLNLFAKL